jgi:hypothetical protein
MLDYILHTYTHIIVRSKLTLVVHLSHTITILKPTRLYARIHHPGNTTQIAGPIDGRCQISSSKSNSSGLKPKR